MHRIACSIFSTGRSFRGSEMLSRSGNYTNWHFKLPGFFNLDVGSSRRLSTAGMNKGPIFSQYLDMISSGLIRSSDDQIAVLAELQRLATELDHYNPSESISDVDDTVQETETGFPGSPSKAYSYSASSTPNLDTTIKRNRNQTGSWFSRIFSTSSDSMGMGSGSSTVASSPFGNPANSSLFSDSTQSVLHQTNAPRGLYVYGGTGCGKTMLMDIFFEKVAVPSKRKERLHFHAFMLQIHQALHVERTRSLNQPSGDALPLIARRFVKSRAYLLCLDEFQVTDIADAMMLQRLFTALFDAGCVVVATSNRPPDELYYGGLNRALFLPFIPILKARCMVHHVRSETDYRLLLASNHEIYHHPLSPKVAFELQRIAESMLGRDHRERVEKCSIIVCLPRDLSGVSVARANSDAIQGRGLARFNFDELCEQPFGASDYLALASTYSVIILEKIPQFAFDKNRGAMRRFITLLDVLYDEHVHLICSAAALPHKLFISEGTNSELEKHDVSSVPRAKSTSLSPEEIGSRTTTPAPAREDESFAFQRTVSRLIEMQSNEYLERSKNRVLVKPS